MTTNWFISTRYRRGSMLALTACILAFCVILLGAYTRLTNAGLSCPDWPNCYGYVTAPHTTAQLQGAMAKFPMAPVDIKKAWTEMVHRYFAGTEGILILLLVGSIAFTRKARDKKSLTIGFLLITLLCTQVMLGMLTVTKNLKPVIVTSHLLTGLSILSVLWWAYLDLHMRHDIFSRGRTGAKKLHPWLWAGLLIVATQISLGGWVSTHYAALACIDFPYCNGTLFPTMHWGQLNTDLTTMHMLHRFGAYTTATYLSILSVFLLKNKSFRVMGAVVLCLVATQVTLGILNILWLRPVWLALMHHGVGIIILLTMITALVKANFESRGAHNDSWIA